MTWTIERLVFGLIGVAADDAVEVPPSYYDTQSDAAFIDAFGVIGDPDDGVGDAGVDSQRTKESACLLDSG